MKAASITVFALCIILNGCKSKNEFRVVVKNNSSEYDTLFIQELITERTIAKVPLNRLNTEYTFDIEEATLGELVLKSADNSYLTMIRPGIKKIISIDAASFKTMGSVPDTLANYLWRSTNQMFSLHDKIIFAQDNPTKVLSLFDSLLQIRTDQLNKLKPELTEDEYGILQYQNEARVYSFLMFYGRFVKQYLPEDEFFDFIDKIDNENIYSKSLPDNLLYKYEIQMLRETDSIKNIDSFLKFIEKKTKTKDLQDYLKAIYLKNVIEYPSYWRKHAHLFTTTTIEEALQREVNNKYSYLIEKASNSFYASQKGIKGFDFTAYKMDGTALKLSDLKGKTVVIDAWATWCGPCVDQRPNMIEMAKKFKDESNITVLMISVDSSTDRWKKYVSKTNPDNYGIELHIPDGMNSEFGDKYLIKAVPKYILIDSDGVIIDSNLPAPSVRMEQLILSANKQS